MADPFKKMEKMRARGEKIRLMVKYPISTHRSGNYRGNVVDWDDEWIEFENEIHVQRRNLIGLSFIRS